MKQKQKDLPGNKKDLPGNKKDLPGNKKERFTREQKKEGLKGHEKDLPGNKKERFTRKQKRKIYQEIKKKDLPGNKKERFTRKQNPSPFLHHQITTSIKMKKTFLEYGTESGPKKTDKLSLIYDKGKSPQLRCADKKQLDH